MAAIRPRCGSARRSGSTTSRARPIACRSQDWPRPKRRSPRKPPRARPERLCPERATLHSGGDGLNPRPHPAMERRSAAARMPGEMDRHGRHREWRREANDPRLRCEAGPEAARHGGDEIAAADDEGDAGEVRQGERDAAPQAARREERIDPSDALAFGCDDDMAGGGEALEGESLRDRISFRRQGYGLFDAE